MQIECIDNSGFEDLLTPGQNYRIDALQGNSVQLRDDSGQQRWYGRMKFGEPGCLSCQPQQAA